MTRRYAAVLALILGFLLVPRSAQAASIVLSFPSAGSTVVGSVGFIDADEMGYFWSVSRGDSITQSFLGTGLNEVSELHLAFGVSQNVLSGGAFVNWNVLLNGIVVGSWSWADGDSTGSVDLSYFFAPIVGLGDYIVRMEVTNEVAGGQGSIALSFPGRLTLEGDSTAVPEPSTVLLVALGGIAAVAARRRSSRKA